jgi:hypothetical protein
MRTLILSYVIALLGVPMIAAGVWGIVHFLRQTTPVPLTYYGMAIGMTCGGFGMLGVAQALRILRGLVALVKGMRMTARGGVVSLRETRELLADD